MKSQSLFLADEAATLALGTTWARCIFAPLVVYLNGDLGAGKTTFTRGVLHGLGYHGSVKSPTYAIVESYTLPEFQLNHFDLYRFSHPSEWEDAGLDDLLTMPSVHFIEWAVQGKPYVPAPDLVFEFSVNHTARQCTISAQSTQGQRSLDLWQN